MKDSLKALFDPFLVREGGVGLKTNKNTLEWGVIELFVKSTHGG